MLRRWSVTGLGVAMATLVASALAALPAQADGEDPDLAPLSVSAMAVPLELSGQLVTWGIDQYGASMEIPEEYADLAFSQAVMPDNAVLALTADGRVVGWGDNQYRLQQIPAAVASEKVVQLTYSYSGWGGAVTEDGRVLVWGVQRARPTPLNDIPAGLSDVKKLVFIEEHALALKSDGTVVAWGDPNWGVLEVPEGLVASDIGLNKHTAVALSTAGTIVQWGYPYDIEGTPASVLTPGNVKAMAVNNTGTLAWLADDSLVAWGNREIELPDDWSDSGPLLLGNGASTLGMVDQERTIHVWNAIYQSVPPVPEGLSGEQIAQISIGAGQSPDLSIGAVILTRMLAAAAPRITGSPKVGGLLTGIAGTFSAEPESVTSQWFANGAPIAGATGSTLSVTADLGGKQITYRSTATKTGEDTVTSSSAAVKVAVPGPVASKTKVTKVSVAKKAAKVAVTGKVTSSKSPAGKAKVTIKKGKKTIVTKTVKVNAKGAAKLTVKKFAKLVAKKLKVKGKKAKTAYKGKYTVTIAYKGTKQVKASKSTKKFTIKK